MYKQIEKYRLCALSKTDRWEKKIIKQHNSLLMISCRAACRRDVQGAHHKIITAPRANALPRLIGALWTVGRLKPFHLLGCVSQTWPGAH